MFSARGLPHPASCTWTPCLATTAGASWPTACASTSALSGTSRSARGQGCRLLQGSGAGLAGRRRSPCRPPVPCLLRAGGLQSICCCGLAVPAPPCPSTDACRRHLHPLHPAVAARRPRLHAQALDAGPPRREAQLAAPCLPSQACQGAALGAPGPSTPQASARQPLHRLPLPPCCCPAHDSRRPAACSVQVPGQENHCDCGLFMCSYIEYFVHRLPRGGPPRQPSVLGIGASLSWRRSHLTAALPCRASCQRSCPSLVGTWPARPLACPPL